MLILALDTTTRAGSVALWEDGRVLEERAGDAARTHAERLPGEIIALLEAHGRSVASIDRYAVAAGPGSFTGMRVGIATIQGLALVNGRRVAPFSSLDALAQCAVRLEDLGAGALVAGWMEAYRGEVFAMLYRVGAPVASAGPGRTVIVELDRLAGPSVGSPDELLAEWHPLADGRPITFAGDGVPATRDRLAASEMVGTIYDAPPLAGILAQLAAAWPEHAVAPHAIVPMYVRRPDAELARDREGAMPPPRAPHHA